MAKRSQHSQEQIKDMVFKAAETIVTEDGFAALKVREIAMEIGYTVGSIYMVFDNMGDLIMQLKGRVLDELAQQLTQVSPSQTAEQQLLALAQTYLTFAQHHFNRWRMVFEYQPDTNQSTADDYQQKIAAIFESNAILFQQLAPQATTEQCKSAARALGSGVHGVCILSLKPTLDEESFKALENNIRLLTQCFIKGWLQNPSC
jgi:AcrR family transcriptional regulator